MRKFSLSLPITPKHIFIFLSIFFLAFYSYLSFDYGIWWDEWTNTHYAELILKYFISFGKDKTATNYHYNMPYYGGLFDTFVVGFYHVFKIFGIYETRHLFNILAGTAGIIFAGLVAKEIGSWTLGIFTLLFLFLSPHYIGNAMNNPKDIPFASGYIMSIYYIIIFIKQLPRPNWSNCLFLGISIAITLGIRAGGLILFFYLIFFSILFIKRFWTKSALFSVTIKIIFIVIIGYSGGIIAWPLAHLHPFTIPYKALNYFTNFPNIVDVLFEGRYMGYDELPWYYIPKLIFLTSPVFIITGLSLFFIYSVKIFKNYSKELIFLLLFTIIFPFLYALYKHSLFYDGWRHFYFIYPGLCIISALGIMGVWQVTKQKTLKGIFYLLLSLILFEPVYWSLKNHPHEGVYFTPLVGGVSQVYSDYQTDCMGNSMRYGAIWLGKYLVNKNIHSATIYTNANAESSHYYLRKFGNFQIIREREGYWEYELLLSRYLTKRQLLHDWPPPGTLYRVEADNVTLCAVVETNPDL